MRPRKPKAPLTEAELYDYAASALGRRMRSVAELKRLMRTKTAHQEDAEALIENVVLRLKDQHYLNDTAYATAYSSFRKENEKFGRQRVITDLKARGVHGDVIEKAIEETYSDVDENALARAYLQRKRVREPQDDKQAARVFRMLMRAGFRTRTIISILKNWNVDDETLTALQTESVDAEE